MSRFYTQDEIETIVSALEHYIEAGNTLPVEVELYEIIEKTRDLSELDNLELNDDWIRALEEYESEPFKVKE